MLTVEDHFAYGVDGGGILFSSKGELPKHKNKHLKITLLFPK